MSCACLCTGSYKDHNKSSKDPIIANPTFAEQENAALKKLKSSAVHMRQTHLLWLTRFMLYRQWRKKHASYFHRNARARANCVRVQDPVIGPVPSEPVEVAEVLGNVLPAHV